MQINRQRIHDILEELKLHNASLVAVSKLKPVEAIKEVYDIGQKKFGENYVQELLEKSKQLPGDIEWHFIGHLQTNKVKLIAPFVSLIHGVESLRLLKEINKEAVKNNRVIDCLLQIHIAQEETKFGLSFEEATALLYNQEMERLNNICVKGLMGMASFTENEEQIRSEFHSLSAFFNQLPSNATNIKPQILSMGMTSDYKIALAEGSNMVRIGSAIFGERS